MATGGGARGRVGELVDDAVERALAARDAAGPLVASSTDRAATVADQLTRARRAGAPGICVAVDALRATAFGGALDADDVAALRALAAATRARPLALLLDAGDAVVPAALEPPPLAALLLAPPRTDAQAARRDEPASVDAEARGAAARTGTAPARPTRARPPLAHGEAPGAAALAHDEALDADRARDEAPDARRPARGEAPDAVGPERATSHPAAIARHAPPPRPSADEDACRSWTLQLTAARGPQPIATIERLFAQAYLPLANAVLRGEGDARAVHAVEEFRRTFEKTYLDACPTFAVTGKRPRMVLDVPDVFARTARLHGARATHLLLVDAMRFDLGARVRSELGRVFGDRATATDDRIVWSALPTTTARQLDGLARGVDVLRAPPPSDRGDDAVRGRTAEVVRRLKVGSREIYKLDLVESRLAGATDRALDAIPAIAEQVAAIVARHAEPLAPRTLLVVFGDHGFRFDDDGRPRQGGATPEEVLVPAFAFLMGAPH